MTLLLLRPSVRVQHPAVASTRPQSGPGTTRTSRLGAAAARRLRTSRSRRPKGRRVQEEDGPDVNDVPVDELFRPRVAWLMRQFEERRLMLHRCASWGTTHGLETRLRDGATTCEHADEVTA